MVARRQPRQQPSTLLVAASMLVVSSLAATTTSLVASQQTTVVVQGEPAMGQPVGASATNGTVSFATQPPSETASFSVAGRKLADKLATSDTNVAAGAAALAPPVVAATSPQLRPPARITGMPVDTQLARQRPTSGNQQHELAVGALEKALLGFPRTIPDDEALQKLGEYLEAQAASQKQKKEKEKFSARIIKGWGFGGGGFLIG